MLVDAFAAPALSSVWVPQSVASFGGKNRKDRPEMVLYGLEKIFIFIARGSTRFFTFLRSFLLTWEKYILKKHRKSELKLMAAKRKHRAKLKKPQNTTSFGRNSCTKIDGHETPSPNFLSRSRYKVIYRSPFLPMKPVMPVLQSVSQHYSRVVDH